MMPYLDPLYDSASTLALTTASHTTHTGPGQAGGPWETRQPQPKRANVEAHHHHHFTWPAATPPPHMQERPPVEEDNATKSPLCSFSFFWARWPRP